MERNKEEDVGKDENTERPLGALSPHSPEFQKFLKRRRDRRQEKDPQPSTPLPKDSQNPTT